jgi:hypothetical protein
MMTSITMATVRARIFTLPGRPPFMIADDLAEFYQVTRKRLMEQVQRNIGRFPDDFIFEMTDEEYRNQLPHFAATAERKRTDLAHYGFTKEGALQLSSVLTGPVADEVSVTIIRTFAELEAQALADAQFMLAKLRTEEATSKRIRSVVIAGVQQGFSFERIWRMANYTRPRVVQALRECLALGLIDTLPKGMPSEQLGLFGNA